jgi:ubiquinone/menaquinone biosynthesis C-methylase UbiE
MSGSFGSAFANVDQSSDPKQLTAFLAALQAVPCVAESKRASIALLGLIPGAAALDVGCGLGDDVATMAEIVGGDGAAVGVDCSEKLIAEARRASGAGAHEATFVVADATSLPFDDGRFDACRADRTIQHIPDADVAVAEMARVTRPGGTVVISEMLTGLDLDGEVDETTAAVLGRLWSGQERRGWIAGFLPLLMSRAGFGEVSMHRDSAQLSSFEEAALVLNLGALSAAAVAGEALSATAAERWLTGLRERFRAGRATLHLEFLHVKASKHTDDG